MSMSSTPEPAAPVLAETPVADAEEFEAVMDENEELDLFVKQAKSLGRHYDKYQVPGPDRAVFLCTETHRHLGSYFRNLSQTVGLSKTLKTAEGEVAGPTIFGETRGAELDAAQRHCLEMLMASLELDGIQTSAKEVYDVERSVREAPKRGSAKTPRKRKVIDDSSESEAHTTDGEEEDEAGSGEEEDGGSGELRRLPSRSARPREGFAAPAPLPEWAYDTPRRPKDPRATSRAHETSGQGEAEEGTDDDWVSLETATKGDGDRPRRLRSGRTFTTPTHTTPTHMCVDTPTHTSVDTATPKPAPHP